MVQLVTLEGSSIIIERIYREQLETPETTYNFEVEDFHTYYVSDVELLVHKTFLAWMATYVSTKYDFQLKDCARDLQILKNAKRIVGLGVKCQLSHKTEDREFLKSKISDIITAEQTVLGSLLEQLQK